MVYDQSTIYPNIILIIIKELSQNFTIFIIDFVSNIIDDIGIRHFAIQYTDDIHNISLKYSMIKKVILTNIIDNIALITLPTQHTHKIANTACR